MSDTSPTVGYNARAFTINGKPELFLSAAIHYFRVPHQLWADRIAKAKRGGMNTIETYVAWNFHESAPGVFDWAGDRGLGKFLDECHRQGMYAIVRPGPYICAEWDYGGFPVWLQTVPNIAFRTMNASYLAAVDRYFDAVTPIIADRQWTRGGAVVLVQVENEYANLTWTRGKDMVVDDDYQHYVRDGLVRRGIEVPLLSCAGYCSGTVEGVNSHNPGDLMPAHRQTHPDKPLFSTEFWTAWYDAWGQPHHTRPASDLEYASLRCWAEGACGYNYYVYHGGTNFGYTPMYIQTTSYDYDAPISETGRLTEKWRAAKRVALFAQSFKTVLLDGEHRREVKATPGLRVTETASKEKGAIVWVDNPDKEKTVTGSVFPYLPEITLGPRELFPYVHDAPIGYAPSGYLSGYAGLVKSDARVLAADVLPDPHDGVRVFVYGQIGETREVVLWSGSERSQGTLVTFAEEPRVYTAGLSQIVVLSTEMAGRTFIHSDEENASVIFGPDDVRDHTEETALVEVAPGKTHTLYSLRPDGRLMESSVEAPPLPAPPLLSEWRIHDETDVTAPDYDDSMWLEIEDITNGGNMIALGNGSNPYGWYRASVFLDEETDAQLHFAACSDRLTLFVNGERIGSSDIPPEDRRQEWTATFDLRLRAGENTLAVLADGLGLIKGDWQIGKGQEHEKKGLYGPVTLMPSGGCYLLDVKRWRFAGTLEGERDGWYENWPADRSLPLVPAGGRRPSLAAPIRWHHTTFILEKVLDSSTPLLARLDGLGKGVLWVNGRNLGRYWQTVGPQRDYYLPEPWLNEGENTLVLVETEGEAFAPSAVSLIWDERAAVVVTLAL